MEEIKKLKKVYEETSGIREISEKEQSLESEIRESKKRADEFHKKIQDITKDTSYEVFMELSKKITELKKEQEDAFQKFIDFKNEASSLIKDLNNKQQDLGVMRLVFHKDKEVRKIQREEREKSILKANVRKVEEKLKTKKKLTTEDIIAMQGSIPD